MLYLDILRLHHQLLSDGVARGYEGVIAVVEEGWVLIVGVSDVDHHVRLVTEAGDALVPGHDLNPEALHGLVVESSGQHQ